MAVITIGSTVLPTPQKMTVKLQDIDAATTTRTADGSMHRDRVVGGATAKRKLELEWPAMETDKLTTILEAIGPVFFEVTYMDPYTAAMRTAEFYAGDREAPVLIAADRYGHGYLWEKLKVDLIEK